MLEAADFASLKPLYRPPFTVSGGFTYTLTYRDKTVVALERGVPVACKDDCRVGPAARRSSRLREPATTR